MSRARRERHDSLLRDLQQLTSTVAELANDAGEETRAAMMYEVRMSMDRAAQLLYAVLVRDTALKEYE